MPKHSLATSADYSLAPDEMAVALQFLLSANIPGMIWGAPGTGKSACVQQAAQATGMDLIDIRGSQLDPVDLRGVPWRDGEITRWAPPAFLPRADAEPTLMFLDELSSVTAMVQAAMYQLCLDRRIGEYELPTSARILAAGNRAEDKAVVHRMSTALASRFIHLDMRVDVDAWQEWALSGGASAGGSNSANLKPLDEQSPFAVEVIFFLKWRPDLISTFDPKSRELAYACPRTWEFVSRLVNAGLTGSSTIEMALLRGTIGEGPAVEFAAFLEVFKSLPPPESILADPHGASIPDKPDVLIALCGALARLGETHNMDALTAFAMRNDMRPEIAEFLITSATKIHPTSRYTKAFVQWESYLSNL